ncbi:MAG: lipopolysaccharide heptosyltransferase II [Francisellaceae bacterium]
MNKYLIIAPSWVGDMVMSQSLYRLIKSHDPKCIIDVLAPAHCAELAHFMPEINEAIISDFKHGQFSLTQRKALGKSLKSKGYTHGIVLPNSWKSALVPFFAGIKKRIGWKGEARYFLLNDIRMLDKKRYQLMIERFCALALPKRAKLPKQLPWPKFQLRGDLTIHQRFALDLDRQYIAICPGAEFGPAKKWPAHYYAEIARYLIDKGYAILLLGGTKDHECCDEIKQHFTDEPIYNFAGRTRIDEAVQLISICDHVFSNDSGLMHIACALDIPATIIYGSSSDKFTPPLSHNADSVYLDDLPCRPCFKRQCPLGHTNCLNQLTPNIIISSFENRRQKHKSFKS